LGCIANDRQRALAPSRPAENPQMGGWCLGPFTASLADWPESIAGHVAKRPNQQKRTPRPRCRTHQSRRRKLLPNTPLEPSNHSTYSDHCRDKEKSLVVIISCQTHPFPRARIFSQFRTKTPSTSPAFSPPLIELSVHQISMPGTLSGFFSAIGLLYLRRLLGQKSTYCPHRFKIRRKTTAVPHST